jgi:uncharacterized membrane protein
MQHLRIATLLLFGIVVFGGVQTAWADVVYSFTTIDVPGATSTSAIGINDSGQIVGGFYDATGNHGFFLDVGGSFTTFDVPSASSETIADGINNSGQIVGDFDSGDAGPTQGSLQRPQSFLSLASLPLLAAADRS